MVIKALKNPITRKRWLHFKEVKRAYISWWILVILYLVSLCSELICNNVPLYVSLNQKSYLPIFRFYPEDTFLGNGKQTRPDYKKIHNSANFKNNPSNWMLFPPIPYGPYESIDPDSIAIDENVTVVLNTVPLIGTVNIRKDYSIEQASGLDFFLGKTDRQGLLLTDYYVLPGELTAAIQNRFQNIESPSVSYPVKRSDGFQALLSLSRFSPRSSPPMTVRLMFRELESKKQKPIKMLFNKKSPHSPVFVKKSAGDMDFWNSFSSQNREDLSSRIQKRFSDPVDPFELMIDNRPFLATFIKEDVRFPFVPVKGHLMGIDSAGRDVFARILYGLRTSLTFGLLLVFGSMIFGIIAGAVQGYYGGIIDITGQRLIEIWSALPFLYIMILMGSVYGRSFSLLLFCYGLFNWIGISYYIRAEFYRLRKQAFVEAARCMGLSSYKIIFKHILPNALVPIITFFPFSLVGAIGSLAALDYLGFGLPAPTPSWGELLFQAQQYRWAWWLILYPSLALFFVMLFGVFIGEGVRNAYDPKRYTRLE